MYFIMYQFILNEKMAVYAKMLWLGLPAGHYTKHLNIYKKALLLTASCICFRHPTHLA